MAEVQKYSLKEKLTEADKSLYRSPSLYGMSALTIPRYINSMRSVMFTNHLKQFLTPNDPDYPFVFTNAENLVGKYSSGYREVKHESEVYRKVVKYGDILGSNANVYKLFILDKKKKKFDVIERKEVEDLTENFGFNYNNDEIDKYSEGDTIKKGTVLYKSTSYDDDMFYGYGKNTTVMYTLDPYTSEDAAVARRGYADNYKTIETEVIQIKLNDNDFLLNLYGEEDGEYKPLPDIGETCTGILGAIRTQFNDQLLYDFKSSSLNRIHDGDRIIYVNDTNEIVDITIFSNNEEIVDTIFNTQINRYLESQNKYYKEINDTCKEIVDFCKNNSGYSYSQEVDYLYKRSGEMLDTKKRWKEGDTSFANMVIEIVIRKEVPLRKGHKVSGRYGNKSVISEIRDDDKMPCTEDGKPVDLLLNLLAIINRTTSFAIYELIITSICYKVRKKMQTMSSYKDKEKLLFDIIKEFNEIQYDEMIKSYNKLSTAEKKVVIDEAISDGIYINQSPVKETKPIFYRIKDILDKYEWIEPDYIYIKDSNGRKIKTLSRHWIGDMYIIKLKQSDRRGFSGRSTGTVDIKGLPTRSFKSKNHMEKHSDSAIRFGEFETLNFSIGVPTEDIALFNSVYRTSIKGREQLVKSMFNFDGKDNKNNVKIDSAYTSRVAEIFAVFFKSLGLEIDFINDDDVVKGYDNQEIKLHTTDNGETILCTDYEFFLRERYNEIKEEILKENIIMTDEQLQSEIEARLKERNFINGPLYDENGSLLFE